MDSDDAPARERKRSWWKHIALVGALLVAVYVVLYLPRRSRGAYAYSQTGELRYLASGLSTSDIAEWSPSGCWWQPRFLDIKGTYGSRGNTLGYFYAPLIAIDRHFNYPTKTLLVVKGDKVVRVGEETQPGEKDGDGQSPTRSDVDD